MQFECSAFIIETLINDVAKGRSNVAPKSIPWDLLRVLVTETYGGKIDSDADFAVLGSLVDRFLTPAAFEEDFDILPSYLLSSDDKNDIDDHGQYNTSTSKDRPTLILPSGTTRADFSRWVDGLPEREPPTFLGLPPNAEKLLLEAHAEDMVRKTRLVMRVLDEGEAVMAEAPETLGP